MTSLLAMNADSLLDALPGVRRAREKLSYTLFYTLRRSITTTITARMTAEDLSGDSLSLSLLLPPLYFSLSLAFLPLHISSVSCTKYAIITRDSLETLSSSSFRPLLLPLSLSYKISLEIHNFH